MMENIRQSLPEAYRMAVRQYQVFRLMNYFHISKKTWEAILKSGLYNKLRHNHDFQ